MIKTLVKDGLVPSESTWRRVKEVDGARALTLFIGVVLILTFLQAIRTWWSLRHIPGPFWAKFTNLQRSWWVKTGRAHLYHQAVHQKYGEVVRIGPRMVSVSNPEALPTIYPIRPGIPKGKFYSALRPYSKGGSMLLVFNTQDENIHKQLKTPIAPLFQLSNVVVFEDLVNEVLTCLSEQLDKRFVATGEQFDLGTWLQYFAFDTMGTMSFSKRYGFLDQGEDVGGMLAAIYGFMKTAAPMTQIPWLDRLLYKNQYVHALRRTPGMAILGFVSKTIGERRENPSEEKRNPDEKPKSRDFLSRFLEIHENNPNLPPWASTAWTFSNVIAGSDSTGMIMRTAMYNLLCHPDTLEKLKQELTDANLSKPYPLWEEVRNLPYLDACVQEAARIHPPFALPFERIVPSGGINVLENYLPEGTLVGGNPYVVNRHEPTFGANVESWDPERWMCDDDAHKRKLEQSLLTFGTGRRVCLGKHIGIFEVKKLIPFLVLNYDINIVNPNMLTVENGFFFNQYGFYCTIKKREN